MLLFTYLTPTNLLAETKPQLQYKSGFGTGLSKQIAGGGSTPTIVLVYYFGKNNCYSLDFGVNPYASSSVKSNGNTVPNQFGWGTGIGAGGFYFLPLARKKLGNSMFLAQGFEWNQNFGKDYDAPGTIVSYWYVAYRLGFEHRANGNVYYSVTTPLGYSQIITKADEGVRQRPERIYTSLWDIFNTITVKIFYLY